MTIRLEETVYNGDAGVNILHMCDTMGGEIKLAHDVALCPYCDMEVGAKIAELMAQREIERGDDQMTIDQETIERRKVYLALARLYEELHAPATDKFRELVISGLDQASADPSKFLAAGVGDKAWRLAAAIGDHD